MKELRISSVNGHIYLKNTWWATSFFCAVHLFGLRLIKLKVFYHGMKETSTTKTVEKKYKALKDLENGMSNKDVFEKYGVPKNFVCT